MSISIDTTLLLRSLDINLYGKKELFIFKIRKHEAEHLRSLGFGWAINSGHGTYHNLLVIDKPFITELLEKYWKDIRK